MTIWSYTIRAMLVEDRLVYIGGKERERVDKPVIFQLSCVVGSDQMQILKRGDHDGPIFESAAAH